MQSDVKGPRQQTREVIGYKGLYTMAEDAKALPDGYLNVAQDVVFDKVGNMRTRDGSAPWWPQLSQRMYLGEMQPLGAALPSGQEAATWTGGAEDTANFQFGFGSRYLATASGNMYRVFSNPIDMTLSGFYAAALSSLNIWFRAVIPADPTSVKVLLTSAAGGNSFTDYTESFDITSNVNAAAAGAWTLATLAFSAGVAVGAHAINWVAVTGFQIVVTTTTAAHLNFQECYVNFSDYSRSFCLGGMEYQRILDGARFLVAAFGDTVYADLNEAKAPYKILSQMTRNTPLRVCAAEDRLFMLNGVDPGWVYTGNSVRQLGFPAPTSWNPAFTYSYSAASGQQPGDQYYYGVTFVYGENGVEFGQSSILMFATPTSVSGGSPVNNQTVLSAIPVGAPGSGVIARRIWRTRQAAGRYATTYMITELADNTTTTCTDGAIDSNIIVAEAGPIDNGIPPLAFQAIWFQKGMVYIGEKNVYWSRVGVDLNSSSEIVPGSNVLSFGQSGVLVGAMEFNGNLYLFSQRGLDALYWQGTVLMSRPVEKTAETSSQNVGGYDGKAITVIQNRYMRWMDQEGQVWRMLPNEIIIKESRPVANLLDNFNNLPLVSSEEYWNVNGASGWNGNTIIGANLSTTEQLGSLVYRNTTLQRTTTTWPGIGNTVAPLSRAPRMGSLINTYNPNLPVNWNGGPNGGRWGPNGMGSGPGNIYLFSDQPGQTIAFGIGLGSGAGALGISSIQIPLFSPQQDIDGGDAFTWKIYSPLYGEDPVTGKGTTATGGGYGPVVASSDDGQANPVVLTWTSVVGLPALEVNCNLKNELYVPAGEFLILVLTRTAVNTAPASQSITYNGATNWIVYKELAPVISSYQDTSSDVLTWFCNVYTDTDLGQAKAPTPFYPVINITGVAYYNSVISATGSLGVVPGAKFVERWWSADWGGNTPQLLSAWQIDVSASLPRLDGSVLQANGLYDLVNNGQSSTVEPNVTETYSLVSSPGYLPSQVVAPFTGAATIAVTFTFPSPANIQVPTSNGMSRISATMGNCIPVLIDPELSASWETSKPTDPTIPQGGGYDQDLWISNPILMPAGALAFGKFVVQMSQNQENVAFYIKSADTIPHLGNQSWTQIYANTNLTYTPAGTDRYFQILILFLDNQNTAIRAGTQLQSMSLGWSSLQASVAPILPPVMFYYKDYTYMSWPSRNARLADSSLALDDYTGDDLMSYGGMQLTNRWSQFTRNHYGAYMTSGTKLIGGPTYGGILLLLRQSSTTDWVNGAQSGIFSVAQTLPMAMGTSFIKTLLWLYLGVTFNYHNYGLFQSECQSYPVPYAGWISPAGGFRWPTLYWSVSGIPNIQGTGVDSNGQYLIYSSVDQNDPGNVFALFTIPGVGQFSFSSAMPYQPEYGFDVAQQERAFSVFLVWAPFDDAQGNHVFPTFTTLGFEYRVENIRGV